MSTRTHDTSPGDTSTGDTSTGDTSTGDTSTGDTSTGDTSTGDTSTGDIATGPTRGSDGEAYDRDMSYIPDRITAEPGRSRDPYAGTRLDVPTWPVEPGRYRLVAAKACPWANRSIIV